MNSPTNMVIKHIMSLLQGSQQMHSLQELVHERHGDLDVSYPPLLRGRLPGLVGAQRRDHFHCAFMVAHLPGIWSSVWRRLTLYLQSACNSAVSTPAWMER